MILTIFTPTYNRAKHLRNIYNSLLEQSTTDFEWLIVDDGSTDDTGRIVSQWISQMPSFDIRYIKKDNGGKHTAINVAAIEAKGDYILWLDSDDRLLPLSLNPFIDKLLEAKGDDSISAVVGLRLAEDMSPLGSFIPSSDTDVQFLSFIIRHKVKGDYSWAIKKDILKKYPFPVFEGEKFCTEGVVLNRISEQYLTRFINQPLIIGEYIQGGLTDNLHKLTTENPLGYLTYYIDVINSDQSPFIFKLKTAILYWNQFYRCKKAIPAELRPGLFLKLIKIPAYMLIKLYKWVYRR